MIVETRADLQLMLFGIACVIAGGLAIMTFVQWLEVRKARHWLPAPGKILSSKVEQREVNVSRAGEDTSATETRNFAAITYEFVVNGKKLQGTRFRLGDDRGNVSVAETLARYPRGRDVTVFYDPADPKRVVIERTLPAGSFKFMAYLCCGIVAGAFGLVYGGGILVDAVSQRAPNPRNAAMAAFPFIIGLIMLRFASVMRSETKASRGWPVAKGRIATSGVEAIQVGSGKSSAYQGTRTVHRSRISYVYHVGGCEFVGGRIAFGMTLQATLSSLVGGGAKAYPKGAAVDVFYDPANPTNAVLERRCVGQSILWLAAAILLAAAARLVVLP